MRDVSQKSDPAGGVASPYAGHLPEAPRSVGGTQLQVSARAIQPGDYLPPQRCLELTAWRRSGFRVGQHEEDVAVDRPVPYGRVLLFGPLGVLDLLAHATVVTVIRTTAT